VSEWQPAIYRRVHERPTVIPWPHSGAPSSEQMDGKLIHVRESPYANIESWRIMGCDSGKFSSVQEFPGVAVCEHEILTD
jgi:hypothetical protein